MWKGREGRNRVKNVEARRIGGGRDGVVRVGGEVSHRREGGELGKVI